MRIFRACATCFTLIRNVVLAAVIYEPENRQFAVVSRHYPRCINLLTVLFCLYLTFLLFLVVKVVVNMVTVGSFVVTVRTERVEYEPESIAPPRIAFHNPTFFWEEASSEKFDPLATDATATKSLSLTGNGSVQIQGKSQIVFSRIGRGALHVNIASENPILVYDEKDKQLASLPAKIDLVLDDLPNLLNQGFSWKYNLDGPLVIGKVPSYGVEQLNGLLIGGEIQMIGRQLLSGNNYKVDPYSLQLGDEIQFTPRDPKTSGLLTFDNDRGLQVVAIVEAESATVKTFRTARIQIRNNLWSKLGKDEELVITWAIVLTVPGMLVFISRLLAFHAQLYSKS